MLGSHLGFGGHFNLNGHLRRSWGKDILCWDILVYPSTSATRLKMSLEALGTRMILGRKQLAVIDTSLVLLSDIRPVTTEWGHSMNFECQFSSFERDKVILKFCSSSKERR